MKPKTKKIQYLPVVLFVIVISVLLGGLLIFTNTIQQPQNSAKECDNNENNLNTASPGEWDEQITESVGERPYDVEVGDANNDGANDIVAANSGSDSVSIILWNETSGAWDSQITKSVGWAPCDVEVGDANNDGANDIVAVNINDGTVSILLWNETSGAWDAQITKSVGYDPYGVDVGDANNDGANDIVVANFNHATVSILLWNKTSGMWDARITKSVGLMPIDVELGDANNDGDIDIVTANQLGDSVSILLWNETSGAWDARITKSVGDEPRDVDVGDANNDGENDIVAANQADDNVSILLWNETSGAWDAQITKSVGDDPRDVEVGDANNDGANDIMAANHADDNASILLWNETSGAWDAQITKSIGNGPNGVDIGDANNDGENDIVTANYQDDNVSILLWRESVPPTWDEIPTNQAIEFGQSFSYDVNASDPSGIDRYWVDDTTNFTIDGEGVIHNNKALSVGDYRLMIYVNDTLGNENSAEMKITVQDTTAPSWNPEPPDKTIEFGQSFSYDVNATDLSGIDHFWLNDTSYFQINHTTGVLTDNSPQVGDYRLMININDTLGNENSTEMKITVEAVSADGDDQINGYFFIPLMLTIFLSVAIIVRVKFGKER